MHEEDNDSMPCGARIGTERDVGRLVELYRASRETLTCERGGSMYLLKEAFGEPLEPHFAAIVTMTSGWSCSGRSTMCRLARCCSTR